MLFLFIKMAGLEPFVEGMDYLEPLPRTPITESAIANDDDGFYDLYEDELYKQSIRDIAYNTKPYNKLEQLYFKFNGPFRRLGERALKDPIENPPNKGEPFKEYDYEYRWGLPLEYLLSTLGLHVLAIPSTLNRMIKRDRDYQKLQKLERDVKKLKVENQQLKRNKGK